MSATTILPPERHTFRTGEAVFYIPSSQRLKQPLAPIPVVMVNDGWRIRMPDGRVTSVHPGGLAHRGYCEACAAPAVVDSSDALICPQCGAPATEAPPPDQLVIRWFPLRQAYTPMAVYRALTHPDWTWKQAVIDAHATIDAFDRGAVAAQQRLGLPVLPRRVGTAYEGDYAPYYAMEFYAFLGDDAAFLAAYEQLAAEQAKPAPPDPLVELVRLVLARVEAEDADPIGPSKRLDLTPLDISQPAGDDQPDTTDGSAFDVWLRSQLG